MSCTRRCAPCATFGGIPPSSFSPTRSAWAPADLPVVERAMGEGGTYALQRARADIGACSFLRFGEDGSLLFTHNSFYEFFIAQDLVLRALEKSSAFRE